jgi:hypothetical protein
MRHAAALLLLLTLAACTGGGGVSGPYVGGAVGGNLREDARLR